MLDKVGFRPVGGVVREDARANNTVAVTVVSQATLSS